MKKILLSALLLMSFTLAFAQQNQPVEMADAMRSSGKIYVVVVTMAVIFAGLAIYLFSIDKRLKKIEKDK
jgi:heme/copper-type cytochrome/quinol oxidase subunit 2